MSSQACIYPSPITEETSALAHAHHRGCGIVVKGYRAPGCARGIGRRYGGDGPEPLCKATRITKASK